MKIDGLIYSAMPLAGFIAAFYVGNEMRFYHRRSLSSRLLLGHQVITDA